MNPFCAWARGASKPMRTVVTLRTVDKTLAAQYEHTIIITEGQPILTTKVSGTGH
ncbi:MAG UNVERIFIED_CONTAM: hypothetical protein LVT10_27340 [Anaerolineae bacterium]